MSADTLPGGWNRSTWIGLLAALFVAAPVLVGMGYSAAGALGLVGATPTMVGGGEVGLSGSIATVTEGVVLDGVLFSLWIASASTLLAWGAAALLALTFRGNGGLDRWARLLAVLPLPIPHVVAGLGGVLVLSQSGLLARLAASLGWIDGPAGMPALVYDDLGVGLILSLAWKEVPFLALVAFSVLAARSGRLEEAARTLGATPSQVALGVTWPLLRRGMLPAVVAVFTFVLGSYEVVALLGPSDPLALPLLTMERYTDAAPGGRGEAYALALLGLALAMGAVALHEWVRRRERTA